MKNLLSCILLFCFFLSNASYSMATSGTELIVVRGKMANTTYTFELPKESLTNGNLNILVLDDSNTVAFSQQTSNLNVVLPSNLSGTFYLVVDVGGLVLTQKITL